MDYNKKDKTLTLSKNTAITFSLSFLVSMTFLVVTLTTKFNDLSNTVYQNQYTIVENKERLAKLEADNTSSKVDLSSIQTQLTNINTSLIEIKQRLSQ